MRQAFISISRTTLGFTTFALLLSVAACDHGAQGPEAGPQPAAPVPTKGNPRNVMPPGGPYAWHADARDRELTAKVRSALKAESGVDGVDIAVSTLGGKVLLSGALPPEQIPRAVQVAQSVDGVRAVDNRLAATG